MKIPEKLRITGIDYTVKFCDTEKHEGRWGMFSALRQEIKLSPEIKDTPHALDALIHEVIHCIDGDMRINLKESQIAALASGLNQVLQDNFLTRDLKKKLKGKRDESRNTRISNARGNERSN